MTSIPVVGALPPVPRASDADTRLRKTALQLEGVFVQRLFAAMRETVPGDGATPKSNAEETFTDLMDSKLAEQAPTQWHGRHSLAEALYHQLRGRLHGDAGVPSAK